MDREEYKRLMLAKGANIKYIEDDIKECEKLKALYPDDPDFESNYYKFGVDCIEVCICD